MYLYKQYESNSYSTINQNKTNMGHKNLWGIGNGLKVKSIGSSTLRLYPTLGPNQTSLVYSLLPSTSVKLLGHTDALSTLFNMNVIFYINHL